MQDHVEARPLHVGVTTLAQYSAIAALIMNFSVEVLPWPKSYLQKFLEHHLPHQHHQQHQRHPRQSPQPNHPLRHHRQCHHCRSAIITWLHAEGQGDVLGLERFTTTIGIPSAAAPTCGKLDFLRIRVVVCGGRHSRVMLSRIILMQKRSAQKQMPVSAHKVNLKEIALQARDAGLTGRRCGHPLLAKHAMLPLCPICLVVPYRNSGSDMGTPTSAETVHRVFLCPHILRRGHIARGSARGCVQSLKSLPWQHGAQAASSIEMRSGPAPCARVEHCNRLAGAGAPLPASR